MDFKSSHRDNDPPDETDRLIYKQELNLTKKPHGSQRNLLRPDIIEMGNLWFSTDHDATVKCMFLTFSIKKI